MIAGVRAGGGGWQTMLADLALILFLVTASALDRPEGAPPMPVAAPQQSAPAAIWHEGPGAPPLARWLAAEQRDPRLQVTLLAAPADGERALQMMRGIPDARLVVAPAPQGQAGIIALLAYDRAP